MGTASSGRSIACSSSRSRTRLKRSPRSPSRRSRVAARSTSSALRRPACSPAQAASSAQARGRSSVSRAGTPSPANPSRTCSSSARRGLLLGPPTVPYGLGLLAGDRPLLGSRPSQGRLLLQPPVLRPTGRGSPRQPGRSASSSCRSAIRVGQRGQLRAGLVVGQSGRRERLPRGVVGGDGVLQALGRLLQRGLRRRPAPLGAAGRSLGGQVRGSGLGPGQQLGPGRAEGLGGEGRGAQRGQSSVRGVEVGPPLLGGGRQSGALVLGVLQGGPRGVAGGGRRPFLLAGRLESARSRSASAARSRSGRARSRPGARGGRRAAPDPGRPAARRPRRSGCRGPSAACAAPGPPPRPRRGAARRRRGRPGPRPGRARPAGRAARSRSGRTPDRRGRPADGSQIGGHRLDSRTRSTSSAGPAPCRPGLGRAPPRPPRSARRPTAAASRRAVSCPSVVSYAASVRSWAVSALRSGRPATVDRAWTRVASAASSSRRVACHGPRA